MNMFDWWTASLLVVWTGLAITCIWLWIGR